MLTTSKHTAIKENKTFNLDRKSVESKSAFASQQNKFNTSPFDFSQIPLQSKLKINTPGDRYEQEADRIADRVLNMNEVGDIEKDGNRQIQRKSLSDEITSTNGLNTQRKCSQCEEEDELVQRKSINTQPTTTTSSFNAQLNATRGSGNSMNDSTNQYMSSRFGVDFSHVNIHTNDKAAKMSQSINAKAFTLGNDIYFNKGEYNPHSNEGKKLLAHELVHTVQQKSKQKLVQKVEKKVEITDNKRICKARREYKILEKSLPPNVEFDADSTNITLNIKWCKGKNFGDITIGANVPQQASNVATDIIDVIRQGGGSSEIEEKLRNADLTPFVNVVIKQGGAFSITAHGEITVDSTGAKSGKGSVDIDLGSATISPNFEVSEDNGWKVGLDLKIPFGGGKVDEVKCKTQKMRIGQILTCECPTPAKKIPGTIEMPILPETKFLYFHYNSANINNEYSEKSVLGIKRLFGLGYRVEKITGYTSPEGTLDSSPGFEGNIDLATKRAETTHVLIRKICSPLKMEDFVKCDSNILKNAKQLNAGELHSSDEKGELIKDKQGKELEGKELAEHAIPSFEKSKKEQQHLGVLNEKEKKDLEGARTALQKSKFIYPLLRRVEITLVKSGSQKIPIEITGPPGKESCPPEVLKKAKKKLPKMPL